MPNEVGTVDDSLMLAHYALLEIIRDFCDDAGWTILRFDDSAENHELIMSAPGYIGPDGAVNAYVGVRTYHSVASDYYNLCLAGFTGYVDANTFDTQPGVRLSGVPAHNQEISYWMTVNDRRLAFALKVGTPVYEHGYLGYCLPYATPRQYPYPLVCGGMLTGASATRFSETTHSMYLNGNRAQMALRFVSGSWLTPYCHPWQNTWLQAGSTSSYSMRPTETTYPTLKVKLHDGASNVFGELDGIRCITGFDNVVENTFTVDGENYVVFQDVWRTSFNNYYGLILEA